MCGGAEAIDSGDTENLCEELGDVLFQVMFHSEIEAGARKISPPWMM